MPKPSSFLCSLICFQWKTILTWSWTLTVVDCAVHLSVTHPRISSSLWQEMNVCTFTSQTNVAPALPSRDKSWLFIGIGDTSSLSPRSERLPQSRAPRNRWVLFTYAASCFFSFPVKLCSWWADCDSVRYCCDSSRPMYRLTSIVRATQLSVLNEWYFFSSPMNFSL